MRSPKLHILFVCTGNSCRSQMAEGWANHLGASYLEARSAGIEAHGKNPRAIQVMGEVGVDISAQESTRLSPDMLRWANWVITVCGHADDHCPVLPAGTRKGHWPLEDPAKAQGDAEQILSVFRSSRDNIRERVQRLINDIKSDNSSS